jgi:hypothetical protein
MTKLSQPPKFVLFSLNQLQEIASLIAGREMLPHHNDDILKEIYEQIIIEIRRRRHYTAEHQLIWELD